MASANASTPAIRLRGVTKVFRPIRSRPVLALDDITMAVDRGQFVSVVGQSGSGKSTLLRLIGGLLEPDSGEVAVGARGDSENRAAFVFQQPLLLDWLSVLDNVLLPGRLAHGLDKELRERGSALLDLVGVGGFESNWPRELSGGMQQRAALARALLLDPPILLLDEPFGSLDALTREEMTLELAALWWRAEPPKSVVMVTHDISEAIFLSDVVVVLSERPGHVVAAVPVDFAHPRSLDIRFSPEFGEIARHLRDLVGSKPMSDVPNPARSRRVAEHEA